MRHEGLTVQRIAETLGVSRGAVGKYSTARPKPPKVKPPARPQGRPPGRRFYDDPRFIHPPEDEYADVIPIPFFPDDLPRLERDPFGWTAAELSSAVVRARKLLTPLKD